MYVMVIRGRQLVRAGRPVPLVQLHSVAGHAHTKVASTPRLRRVRGIPREEVEALEDHGRDRKRLARDLGQGHNRSNARIVALAAAPLACTEADQASNEADEASTEAVEA